jgi:capsule polysaccharide export protein KpsE/RkpR
MEDKPWNGQQVTERWFPQGGQVRMLNPDSTFFHNQVTVDLAAYRDDNDRLARKIASELNAAYEAGQQDAESYVETALADAKAETAEATAEASELRAEVARLADELASIEASDSP